MSTTPFRQSMDARSFSAGQSFVSGVKLYWHNDLYPAVRNEYDKKVSLMADKPQTPSQVGEVLKDSLLYRYFSWFERHMQRYKYAGRYGLIPWHEQQRTKLEETLKAPVKARVELNPELEMPRYYESCDIHQHPGGVWSDTLAGFVYQRAASTTTPLAGDRHGDMHDRFADIVRKSAPNPQRVLEMGCGFGKTTGPIRNEFPTAEIEAVDLSGPCIQVAAMDVPNVRFRQMNAAETDYPDAHFDVVTSSMLLHEMPPPTVEKTLAEAARVLKPGGKMIHLDFYHFPNPFARFIHYSHGRRNNEPFMEPLAEMDLQSLLTRLGFKNISVEPFEESEGALAAEYASWRFPWTVISAERA